MTLENRLQRRVSQDDQILRINLVLFYFVEADMTIHNYDHLRFKKDTRIHFFIVILVKKDCTSWTESGSRTFFSCFSQLDRRESKFGLRQCINIVKLYALMVAEF